MSSRLADGEDDEEEDVEEEDKEDGEEGGESLVMMIRMWLPPDIEVVFNRRVLLFLTWL